MSKHRVDRMWELEDLILADTDNPLKPLWLAEISALSLLDLANTARVELYGVAPPVKIVPE